LGSALSSFNTTVADDATEFSLRAAHSTTTTTTSSSSSVQRQLEQKSGLGATLVNAMVGILTPEINKAIQILVQKDYDMLSLQQVSSNVPQELGSIQTMTMPELVESDFVVDDVNATTTTTNNTTTNNNTITANNTTDVMVSCTVVSDVRYDVTTLYGLSGIEIVNLEFVSGSQQLNVGWFDDPSTWSAQWRLEARFTSPLTATTVTTIETADACTNNNNNNIDFDETMTTTTTTTDTLNGSIEMQDVAGEALVTVRGTTEQLILFATTTTIDSADLISLEANLPSITTKLGSSWSPSINVDEEYGSIIKQDWQTRMQPILQDALRGEIEKFFPVKLDLNT